jgi:hypothetical protein
VQRFCKPKVGGSNPSPGTNKINKLTEEYRATARLELDGGQRYGQQNA